MHFDQFWRVSKSCHFANISCFLKPFFAQNNLNVLVESFFTRFSKIYFLTQSEHFAKAIAHAFWPILPIFKKLSFCKYLVFFEAVFCTEQLKCARRIVFHTFFRIVIFDPKWAFCKGYSPCILTNFGDFKNVVIFRVLGVFWSRYLHRTI